MLQALGKADRYLRCHHLDFRYECSASHGSFQIAGIMLDNFARGRTKHIWFSISADLIVDARRDLSDIGCHVKVIEGAQQLDKETRWIASPPRS